MLGLWSTPFYSYVDDLDDGEGNLPSVPDARKGDEDGIRDRKRQRRSIFFAGPDSDSEDDDDDHVSLQNGRALGNMRSGSLSFKLAMVPATPFSANPLRKGAFALTPSFPRRSSSPCLELDCEFVAVHEEANAGFRNYMEDRSAKMTVDGVAYLGIFDGHGGIDASTFLQRHLLPNIKSHLQPGCDVHEAMTAAYSATNAAFRATGSIQGSTATTIILQKGRLIAANVGDSPAFVVKKSGEVYSVIQEHKIEGEEAARIAAQGVPIYRSPTGPAYMGTPDGTRWLNMSRAFGDFVYPAISCEPHVCSLDVSDGRYLVMGSDGLTEKWSVAEAAQYVTQLAADGWGLTAICRSMVQRSLARGSTDNISCMIVDLEAFMLHVEGAADPAAKSPSAAASPVAECPAQEDAAAEAAAGQGTGEAQQSPQQQKQQLDLGQPGIAAMDEDDLELDATPMQQRSIRCCDQEGSAGHSRRSCTPSGAEGLGKRPRDHGEDTDGSGPRPRRGDTASPDLLLCQETPVEDQRRPGSPCDPLQSASCQAPRASSPAAVTTTATAVVCGGGCTGAGGSMVEGGCGDGLPCCSSCPVKGSEGPGERPVPEALEDPQQQQGAAACAAPSSLVCSAPCSACGGAAGGMAEGSGREGTACDSMATGTCRSNTSSPASCSGVRPEAAAGGDGASDGRSAEPAGGAEGAA